MTTTETAYFESFGCTSPVRDDWGDCTHEGDCTWGWACSICFRPLDGEPCPDHAPVKFPGLQLIECTAEPKHWTWVHASDGYPPPCPWCDRDAAIEAHSGCAHALHGAWRSWKVTGLVDRWGARVGLWKGFTWWSSGGGCNGCRLRFRWAPRYWILGVRKTTLTHVLRHAHRPVETHGEDWCKRCHPDPCLDDTDLSAA